MNNSRNSIKQLNGKDWRSLQENQRIFHAKMDTIQDRKCKGLREAEEIKKWWQEYTDELYKRVLMSQITMMV